MKIVTKLEFINLLLYLYIVQNMNYFIMQNKKPKLKYSYIPQYKISNQAQRTYGWS